MFSNAQRLRASGLFRVIAEIRALLTVALLIALVASGGTSATADESAADDVARPQPPGTLEFIGKNLISTAKGTFHSWRVLESAIDLADLSATYAVVEVDLDSLDTGIKRRDDHLRNPDFFEVETYPVARVRAHNLSGKGESEAGQPLYSLDFEVDLHGVQKTVPGEIEQVSVSPPVFEGRLVIDRTQFGVGEPASRWNPMAVKVLVPVSFRVAF